MPSNFISICSLNDYENLEQFLIELTGLSKSSIKKKIPEKKNRSQPIRKNQEIQLSINIVNHQYIKIGKFFEHSRIIRESEDILAVSKPAQCHSYPLNFDEEDNILGHTLFYRPQLKSINSSSRDRSLLYRLDYETSGLVLLAKNQKAFDFLRTHFDSITHQKCYLAIVHGKALEKEKLQNYLKPSGPKNKKMLVTDQRTKFLAELTYELVDYDQKKDLSLIKVYLKQGHRHQIRAQLSSRGFPILGEQLYADSKEAKRLYLHCYEYKIQDEVFTDSGFLLEDFFSFNSQF